jgi:hypothetical protein
MEAAPAPVNPVASRERGRHVVHMVEKDKEDRLAAALRENLKRRKAQARAKDQPQEEEKKM